MIFSATLEQMAFLFSLIFIGYALMKAKVLPDNASAVLSKLENYIFLPALVLDIFISNFSVSKLETSYKLMLFSIGLMLVMILLSRVRKLSVYGVSVGGAAAHSCGQVAAAVLSLGNMQKRTQTAHSTKIKK